MKRSQELFANFFKKLKKNADSELSTERQSSSSEETSIAIIQMDNQRSNETETNQAFKKATVNEEESAESQLQQTESIFISQINEQSTTETQEIGKKKLSEEMKTTNNLPSYQNDIALYVGKAKELTTEEKLKVLKEAWSPDTKYVFPADDCGRFKRRFQGKWLVDFPWLAYSPKEKGSFCKFCVLFLCDEHLGKGSHVMPGKLVSKACTNLKDALELFRGHEKREYHKKSIMAAENIKSISEKKLDDIASQVDNQRKIIAKKNRESLMPIIQTIRLCGKQQFALRGHQDSGRILLEDPEENDGNFRALLRFRANGGDNSLKNHLLMSRGNAMYTSPLIQNELIETFGELIQEKIRERVSKSGIYSILADETTDIARVQQFSLCLRYVDEDISKVREDFLTFVPVHDVSGKALCTTIKDTLRGLGFDLENLRGQGYDGAASMRGHFRGVQAIMKEDYPKALYTHCVSHSLNLCLSDSSKIREMRNMFGTLTEICDFFNSSSKRLDILKKWIYQLKPESNKTKLKNLCETRWVLRHEAVLIFKEFLLPITAAIEEIDSSGKDHSKAHGFLNTICSFNFLVPLCIACKILSYTYNLSQSLQEKNLDLSNAINMVNSIKSILHNMRVEADAKFRPLYEEVKSLAVDLNAEESIPRICRFQQHRLNIPHETAEDYYRRGIFIPYLDDILSSLEERFLSHEKTLKSFRHLIPSNSDNVEFSSIEHLVKFYETDLIGFQNVVEAEWEMWKKKWSSVDLLERPSTAIDAFAECNAEIFPNIRQLLKILCVLPVTIATAERSFSTLRSLKTYLRNTMSETRLNGLALQNIHYNIQISDDMVLDKFSKKSRRMNFIL